MERDRDVGGDGEREELGRGRRVGEAKGNRSRKGNEMG